MVLHRKGNIQVTDILDRQADVTLQKLGDDTAKNRIVEQQSTDVTLAVMLNNQKASCAKTVLAVNLP
jgi:hypothetical protein